MDIGDTFRIDFKKIIEHYPTIPMCKYPNKVFVIDHFSKSEQSVYYLDKRTSSKCGCGYCKLYNVDKSKIKNGILRSQGINYIIIVETRLQRERNIKLRSLNI